MTYILSHWKRRNSRPSMLHRTSYISLFRPPVINRRRFINWLRHSLRTLVSDAAGRDRLGQNLHDGQRHRAVGAACAGVCAQQNACGAVVRRVSRVLSAQCGRVLCFVLRLLPTGSLLERRDTIIVASVSAIYGIGNPSEYHRMVLTLRAGDAISQRDVIARL